MYGKDEENYEETCKNNVYWVGKTDWELRTFHGYQYSTHKALRTMRI